MKDKKLENLRKDIISIIEATQCEYEYAHETPAIHGEDQYILECNLNRVFCDNGFADIEGDWRPDILKKAEFQVIKTGTCGIFKTLLLGDTQWRI